MAKGAWSLKTGEIKACDVVFSGDSMGEVIGCTMDATGAVSVLVELHVHAERISAHCSVWEKKEGVVVGFRIDSIRFPLAWKEQGPDSLFVICN